ncbi:LEAF RUST 10 DISEASE-RESISTANCE LOCUS RECEPTOR-LIKE PROTEIN KINASE-like 2.1 [Manihot esculenta]|uniref:LEAF RUST 10 DISEASE-RESISTANCE LOCUS RECEPTOR-LIKE PROTEIN KINASE-like 2.1 n=1 Tax=Manihot esculenta TaxID=3983 RepID=UPI000B8E12ED|nr:LEAF RUST 10 DISEASE-RESISTANCE LOCUS RECEPTOR-LIKE PROTEIN KINASE-like 2.1 [Manihot esculenta]
MKPLFFLTLSLIFIITIVFLCPPPSVLASDAQYQNCSTTFRCGNITNIGYPFWGSNRPDYCGNPNFWLTCTDQAAEITIKNLTYQVLEIDSQAKYLKVARKDYIGDICPNLLINATLDFVHFSYASDDIQNITLYYGCSTSFTPTTISWISNQFTCNLNGSNGKGFYATRNIDFSNATITNLLESCNNSVIVPATQSAVETLENSLTEENLVIALEKGFGLQWEANNPVCETCTLSGGTCGYNTTTNSFACYCTDQPADQFSCRESKTNNPSESSGLAIAAASVITFSLGCYCCFKRQGICSGKTMTLQWKNAKREEKMETFFMNYHSQKPKQYSYSDIEKMTNSFTQKLGEGGFGGVYKGELPDGHSVAVKVLNKSTGDGEEFINEVASISRTSHVNIVSLLGFCYERTKRALIYEYMPNGSLDKFICGQSSELGWKILYDIAIGIASGLEYLHRGCNTRIVHFDIKPQNVLLDEDFCPKISDFGLAKLCNKKESILSMLGARGTPGYIAPEVFMTSFGRVSYKSDVYSYGMMILEMFGGKNNIDFGASQDSEMYFPDCLYKRLELGQNFVLDENIQVEEEQTVIRRMIIVGLWCIQTSPSDRPSMTRVLEMLEGRLQPLQIPPKPLLFSTATPMEHSRATHLWSQSNQEVVSSLAEVELAPNSKQ